MDSDRSVATAEWRPVPGWECYEVSNLGGVRRTDTGRDLRQQVFERDPYPAVVFKQRPRKPARFRVHALVLTAFVGPRPFADAQARHLDGNQRNNRLDNLTWGSPVENQADRKRHGTGRGRIANGRSPITELDVLAMRSMFRSGAKIMQICRALGLNCRCVSDAVRGVTWKHVPGAVPATDERPPWFDEAVALRQQGMSLRRIGEQVGVSLYTVCRHIGG